MTACVSPHSVIYYLSAVSSLLIASLAALRIGFPIGLEMFIIRENRFMLISLSIAITRTHISVKVKPFFHFFLLTSYYANMRDDGVNEFSKQIKLAISHCCQEHPEIKNGRRRRRKSYWNDEAVFILSSKGNSFS